jgi:hypothetical protein
MDDVQNVDRHAVTVILGARLALASAHGT